MRKRGNGEGSIYQMSDGRWRAAVSLGWRRSEGGEITWRRKVVTGRTRQDVQVRLTQLLHEQQRGIPIDYGRQTVGQFLTTWLENTVKPSVRPKTYTSYEQMLRNHLVKTIPPNEWKEKELDAVPGLNSIELAKLTVPRFQQFLNEKLQAGNSPALVSYLRVVLRAALKHAITAELVSRNVAALATAPLVEKREIVPFTAEQAGRFLQVAKGHRLEALFTVALAVGLRSGEAAGLRWPDVDLDRGTVTVRWALQRRKKQGLVLVPPKSEKSRRTIELPGVCIAALKQHRERQVLEMEWAGSGWRDTNHVFTTTIGTPLDDRRILREFTSLVQVAKLPRQRFHDLRHACISLLAAPGVPLKVISEIVGHSDIRLTQNVYQHVFQPAKREAADKMDQLLTSVATLVATNGVENRLNLLVSS